MSIKSWDGLITRIGTGHTALVPFWGELIAATSGRVLSWSAHTLNCQKFADIVETPALPVGVTSFIPSAIQCIMTHNTGNSGALLVGWFIKLGSLNLGTNTFTDGAAMPTVTELGVSRSIPSAPLVTVNTVLNSAPGTFYITYTDEDGNSQNSPGDTMLASAAIKTGDFVWIQRSGDTGVVDITAAVQGSGTVPTGIIDFWGCIPFGIALHNNNTASTIFMPLLGPIPSIHRLPAAAQIGFWPMGNTNTRAITGNVYFIGDN